MDLVVDSTAAARLLETRTKDPQDIRTVVKFHEPWFLKKELAWIWNHGSQGNGEKSSNQLPQKALAHYWIFHEQCQIFWGCWNNQDWRFSDSAIFKEPEWDLPIGLWGLTNSNVPTTLFWYLWEHCKAIVMNFIVSMWLRFNTLEKNAN